LINHISESTIRTELHKDINAVFDLLEAIKAHDVRVNEGRKSHESLYFSFITLSLHSLYGYQTILLGRITAKDFSETSFAQYTVRIQVKIIG
jgi:hypothetical protein